MDCSQEIKNVFVTSENRDKNRYPSGNSYTLHLTTPIKDISKVELLQASIPNSIYNLVDGSNVIALSNVFVGDTLDTSQLTYFSIPPGYYSAPGLATEIQLATSNVTNLSVSFLPNEGKMLFSRPTSGNAFSLYTSSNVLGSMLGVNANQVIQSTSVNVATGNNYPLYSDHSRYRDKNFIKSTQIVDKHPNQGVFLDIQELRTILNEDAKSIGASGTYSGQNINMSFGMIPMDVNSGDIKHFKKYSDFDFDINYPQVISKLDRLSIQWVDRFGIPINFNGVNDNSFVLRFHTLRRNLY